MPKFNGVSEVKDNDIYEQLVKQGSFTGSDGVVYTYDQTGRLYVTDDHVEEELRGYITDLQNKVNSLESGSSNMSENKLDKNLGAENSGKLLNVDSSGNITTLDNGTAGQVLTSNGESQSPIWSNLDLPEQNVVSLTGTQEDPIVLYDDIEAGKIYFLSGYIKVVQPATAYSLPDSKPTIMCIGLWLNNEKTIEVRGVQFTSTGVYSQGWNFIQTITFHSSSSWGSNSYLSLNSINGTDTTALNVYAPTVSGTSGQILQSNGSDKAPTWIDLPNSGIEILTGTAESPINFATDMEVNHLYSCSGVFFNTVSSSAQSSISGKTVNFQDQGRSFLFYKRNNTSVVCLASSHNTGNQTTSVIIFSAMYGITEITFDSTTGELTNIRSGMGFGRVNGIEGNGNAQALGIYAPIESGTSGQLLQSNGEGVAPTWVTANYASSTDLETKLDVNQGTENINKLLNVGSDGNIAFIDNNYITSSVNNLDNYYLKTETYTREEVNNQINTIRTGLFKPVDVLPDVGEEGYIYLVSNSSSQGDISTQAETENVRDEYIWIADNNKYEYIGSTSIDLTNYYTKDEAAAKTDIPTEYLVEAFNGYYFGSTKTYSGIKVTNNTNKSYGVYFDPDDFESSVTGSISGTGYDYRVYNLKDVVRTTDIDQEIAGIKNYIGGLQKNSVDVATVNDIPTTLSELTEDTAHRLVTDTEKAAWNAKSDFSGDYNDLINKPIIPTINVNGSKQTSLNFTSDPQTQINGILEQVGTNTGDISTLENDIQELGNETNQLADDLTNEISNRTSADNNLQSQIYNKADDDEVVKLAGEQTITGTKTFSSQLGIKMKNGTYPNSLGSIKYDYYEFKIRTTDTSDNGYGELQIGQYGMNYFSSDNNNKGKVVLLYNAVDVNNGCFKYADGRMEQHFTVTGSRGKVTPHTFLEPFKSGTTPIVHRTIDIDGSGNASQLRGWNISNLTNTGFSIYTTDISGSTTSMISAYGYWK